MRHLWTLAGLISVAVGLVGIVLPLLPTVPLMILAAFCFARSSPRLHAWLTGHPTYGPHIRDWQERGAIGRGAKRLATASILAAFTISVLLGLPAPVMWIQATALSATLAFIWTRPSG